MKKFGFIALAAALLASMLLAGCAAKSSENLADEGYYAQENAAADAPQYDAGSDANKESAESPESGGAGNELDYDSTILQPGVNRKIVYYGTISAQTENFDADYNGILAKLNELEGYVQSSSVTGTKPEEWQETGRCASMTLRVPNAKFDAFMKYLGSLGETISTSVSGDDISLQYFDTETRLKTLRTREERLQALLEKAATMEDIIELEQALADVSYEIQSLEMTLRDYDSLIDYSTVTITLQEVQVINKVTSSPKTLGERISQSFYSVLNALADFGEWLIVFLAGAWMILLPLGAVIWLIVWRAKRNKRKRAQQAAEAMQRQAEAMRQMYPPQGNPAYPPQGNPVNPQGGNQNEK